MLIQNNSIKNDDIVTLKLITGDEIVAKAKEITTTGVKIEKPVIISLSVDKITGQPALQMLPFFVISSDHDALLPIKNEHIITMVKSNKDVKSSYIQNTTGLAIPKTGF